MLALGNAYEVNTVVLQSNVDKCWTTDLSSKNNFTTNLYFSKGFSPHVDPIVLVEDKERGDNIVMTHYVPPSKKKRKKKKKKTKNINKKKKKKKKKKPSIWN